MKYTRWAVKGFDRTAAVNWFKKGINPLTAVLLAARGISDDEAYNEMVENRIEALPDPFLLSGMDKAVSRIKKALETGEKVGIFGDYDVDGISSTCMMTRYFREKGLECENYIPERVEDGYGLQPKGIEQLKRAGVTLVISVDCGITAFEAAEYAANAGLDLIITDHHEAAEKLPKAVAVVNAKLPGQKYPNRHLSGVGVAFKVICAVEGPENTESMVEKYSDLVAAGTVSDVMPLLGENRIFVRHGLEMLRRGSHIGFEQLGQKAGIDMKTLGTVGMSYMLAPRINAAGRLGKTGIAKDLLMTDDEQEAKALARQLCDLNYERQQVEVKMMEEAEEMMKSYPSDAPIVLASSKWHQGVAGIVASRIMEKHNRPTVIICIQGDMCKGSCRSLGGFSIHEGLKANKQYLASFGGHKYASGISLLEENIDKLREGLTKYYRSVSDMEAAAETVLEVDFEVVKPELLTIENITALHDLEPYGAANPFPRLCMRNAEVDMVTSLGRGKHTKLWVTKKTTPFECLFFNNSPESLGVKAGDRVDVAFEPKINEFRGRRSVQLQLADICISR